LVEAKTYRFHGHSLGDEEQYRSSDEVETWKTDRDPITLFRTVMMHKNWLTEDEDTAIQEEAKDEIVNAVKFAEESPYPTVANVTTDVLAPKQEVA
jgi:TPP-dependent pyruvate/acetoin dehydrogenase alpha subunit